MHEVSVVASSPRRGWAARVALCVAVGVATPVTQAQPAGCLTYTAEVRLTGVLERRTYPGPPNYESVRRGDRPEVGYYLRLRRPVCAVAGAPDAPDQGAVTGVREVQLVAEPAMFAWLRRRVGRVVSARGALFSAHTGHHHAPLLLQVRAIDPQPDAAPDE